MEQLLRNADAANALAPKPAWASHQHNVGIRNDELQIVARTQFAWQLRIGAEITVGVAELARVQIRSLATSAAPLIDAPILNRAPMESCGVG